MEKILVFGHKNPDTDTICSAIAYANLKQKLGVDAEAVRLGQVNGETQYALDYFKAEAPSLVGPVTEEVNNVNHVDHNERQQSADGIEKVKIVEVIDHHRVANFETSDPLYFRVEPVGCTATILNKMYKENKAIRFTAITYRNKIIFSRTIISRKFLLAGQCIDGIDQFCQFIIQLLS